MQNFLAHYQNGRPDLLGSDGYIKLLKTEEIDQISHQDRRIWCVEHARYIIPTIELIEWLKGYIGDRKAIEIGSGSGDVCQHLGIIGTDNKMQTWKSIRQHYASLGQPVIKYPSCVQTMDAIEAIKHHKPDIVLGCWVTQWINPKLPPPSGGGNIYGIKEEKIISSGATYIVVGNRAAHGNKAILEHPHRIIELDCIRSRAEFPDLDCIYIWNE